MPLPVLPDLHSGPPPLTLTALSDVPCPLPRWTVSVHDGYRLGALPRRVLPDPFCLPRFRAGSASTSQLSGPARTSHSLRPAGLLAHLSVDFSREVPISPVTRTHRSPAIEPNHQLLEWVLPPLVISPFGAHAEAPALPTLRSINERGLAEQGAHALAEGCGADQFSPGVGTPRQRVLG